MDPRDPMEWEDEYTEYMQLQAPLPQQVCGLRNIGNSCYLNAVLQALLSAGPLRRYLGHLRVASRGPLGASSLVAELVRLGHRMRASAHSEAPLGLMREVRLCNPMFDGFRQHDAHELLLTILEEFDDHSQALIHPFKFSISSTLTCGNCFQESPRDEPSQGLSVELPSAGTSGYSWWNPAGWFPPTPDVDLYSCLDAFFESETLDEDNLWKCEKCNSVASGTTKKLDVSALPELLPIHIKRFKHQPQPAKLEYKVTYPVDGLDLAPYFKGNAVGTTLYDLSAVVCHYGSLYHGHYVSYIYCKKEDCWILCDDSTCTRVHPSEVATLYQSAFILFYLRRPTELHQNNVNAILDTLRQSSGSHSSIKYISHCWWNRLKTYSFPGPIMDDSLCKHSMLSPSRVNHIDTMYVDIPTDIAQKCIDLFGGAEFVHEKTPSVCRECMTNNGATAEERLKEKEEAVAFDRDLLPGERWVLIDSDWLVRWYRYCVDPDAAPPGPVDNSRLVGRSGHLREDMQPIRDYRKLTPPQYDYLVSRHGCVGAPQHLTLPNKL